MHHWCILERVASNNEWFCQIRISQPSRCCREIAYFVQPTAQNKNESVIWNRENQLIFTLEAWNEQIFDVVPWQINSLNSYWITKCLNFQSSDWMAYSYSTYFKAKLILYLLIKHSMSLNAAILIVFMYSALMITAQENLFILNTDLWWHKNDGRSKFAVQNIFACVFFFYQGLLSELQSKSSECFSLGLQCFIKDLPTPHSLPVVTYELFALWFQSPITEAEQWPVHILSFLPKITLLSWHFLFFISYFLLPLLYLPLCDPFTTDSSIKERRGALHVCLSSRSLKRWSFDLFLHFTLCVRTPARLLTHLVVCVCVVWLQLLLGTHFRLRTS